jgi:hypothetical protein
MQKLKASRVRIKENCQTPTDLFLQGGAATGGKSFSARAIDQQGSRWVLCAGGVEQSGSSPGS